MTPADRRITELIDKWLASIDLHLKYVELSDAAYARAQAWPKHDRPTRWVLEVARQKILELKAQCETRQAMGDGKFSESLELMVFLANLVGIQHIQRFVPLADPSRTEPSHRRLPPSRSCSRRARCPRRSRGRRAMTRRARCLDPSGRARSRSRCPCTCSAGTRSACAAPSQPAPTPALRNEPTARRRPRESTRSPGSTVPLRRARRALQRTCAARSLRTRFAC